MNRSVARVAMASLLLPAGLTAAETFYNKDGVQLSAMARVIDTGAATCRIREERHTAEQYEKLKQNEGRPLNVWRVELVVANYSGETLDYLNAHINVESAWPPCDNWDGLGNYGKPVVWTGPLMTIHDVGSVEPGEERREIEFVLAWHEDDPVLGRWDINYNFEAAPPAGGGAAETRSGNTGSRTAAAPEREAAGTAEAPLAGRSGPPTGTRPEDTCAGKEVASSCWMQVANHPGCYVWNPNLQREETVTWTGSCSGGRASGAGQRTWSYTDDGNPKSSTGTGELRNGRENGHWTHRFAEGDIQEGPYVDGKRNGHWTLRFASGSVYEGSFVNDERHGYWTERWQDLAAVYEGSFVAGERHGRWTLRWDDGNVTYDCYSNGDEVDCP
ncbi:MAG: hypothetical protein OXP74_10985 [Acidobacteriota bacterium]|nr:hypothetical protein [Acidobacteriota bacterium]